MKRLLIIINLFIIFSCQGVKKDEKNADLKLFNKAIKSMENNKFNPAADYLDELQSNHPFSDYIDETEVLLAFINYVNKNYSEAYNYAEKFIKLRPANENVAYMYYLRSLALNKQSSDYLREQSNTLSAQRSFREVIIRFPNSKYAKDSTIKLNYIANKLAAHKMALVRFYEIQKLYLSALNIIRETIKEYPHSPYNAEAYFREIEILTILELYEIRDNQLQIMLKKHPGSEWSIAAKELSIRDS